MLLRTKAGTTEDGNVPQIVATKTSMMQISVCYEYGDGTVCTVYVDGMEHMKMNAGQNVDEILTLEGSDLNEGTHTVEVVATEGGPDVIYKEAEYAIVK